jgi:hypothetical protein
MFTVLVAIYLPVDVGISFFILFFLFQNVGEPWGLQWRYNSSPSKEESKPELLCLS